MSTIKSLASDMSKSFIEGAPRNDGKTFRKLRDGHPEWMRDVCHKAHGDMMPDDHRYSMIEDVVDAISESSEDDINDVIYSIEAPIYTSELTEWLNSRADRTGYCDEAIEEYGGKLDGVVHVMQLGYMAEFEEVFGLVVSALEELADDDSEESDD
jgi:hypothetical protein